MPESCLFGNRWYRDVLWNQILQWLATASRARRECSDRDYNAEGCEHIHFQSGVGFSQENLLQWWWMCHASSWCLPFPAKFCSAKCHRIFSTGFLVAYGTAAENLRYWLFSINIWIRREGKDHFFSKRMLPYLDIRFVTVFYVIQNQKGIEYIGSKCEMYELITNKCRG